MNRAIAVTLPSVPRRLRRSGLVVVAAFAFTVPSAHAQRGPGGPGGPGRGPGLPAAPPSNNNRPGGPGTDSHGPPAASGNSTTGTSSGGLQVGPPGRWWDDKQYAKTLGIDASQQHRMDQVFNANRDALFARYTELKHQEAELTRLTQTASPDEKQVDVQIEKVSQARADLAKANAHMVLALRKELTPEQSAKLDQH